MGALFVVVAEADCAARDQLQKAAVSLLGDWPEVEVLVPENLGPLVFGESLPRDAAAVLFDYLGANCIPRVIRSRRRDQRIYLIWDREIPEWTVAGSYLTTAVTGVWWIAPPAAPWGSPVRGLLQTQGLGIPVAREGDAADRIVGESDAIQRVRDLVRVFANLRFPVLIIGETGTSKQLVARALHAESDRVGQFATLNGALLDRELASSTLFGYRKGESSETRCDHAGRIAEAENGTFFLDELNCLPAEAQWKLLRSLRDAHEEVIRLLPPGPTAGAQDSVRTRFVSGVRRADPDSLRPDLYFRVADLTIELPPLRRRGDDVLLLAESCLRKLNDKPPLGEGPSRVGKAAIQALSQYQWPGNVCELQQVIRQAWVLARADGRQSIGREDLRFRLGETLEPTVAPVRGDLRSHIAKVVETSVRAALAQYPGNKTKAARALGFRTGQAMERHLETHLKQLERAPGELDG